MLLLGVIQLLQLRNLNAIYVAQKVMQVGAGLGAMKDYDISALI